MGILISAWPRISPLAWFSHFEHPLRILWLIEVVLLMIVCSGLLDFSVQPKINSSSIKNVHYPTQPKLKGWDDERLLRKPMETDMEYATRINKVVGSAFYHCMWSTKENIFEVVASHFSKYWDRLGFLQPNRNCGFCHQASYILAKLLYDHGINAYPLTMNGHVCVLMKDDGKEYIFDPDYAIGPMPYQDDMTIYIPEFYGTSRLYKSLYEPYATKSDDTKYSSMQRLIEAEKMQNKILSAIKIIYYLCLIFFIINSTLIAKIIILRKRRISYKILKK